MIISLTLFNLLLEHMHENHPHLRLKQGYRTILITAGTSSEPQRWSHRYAELALRNIEPTHAYCWTLTSGILQTPLGDLPPLQDPDFFPTLDTILNKHTWQ